MVDLQHWEELVEASTQHGDGWWLQQQAAAWGGASSMKCPQQRVVRPIWGLAHWNPEEKQHSPGLYITVSSSTAVSSKPTRRLLRPNAATCGWVWGEGLQNRVGLQSCHHLQHQLSLLLQANLQPCIQSCLIIIKKKNRSGHGLEGIPLCWCNIMKIKSWFYSWKIRRLGRRCSGWQ